MWACRVRPFSVQYGPADRLVLSLTTMLSQGFSHVSPTYAMPFAVRSFVCHLHFGIYRWLHRCA